MFLETLESLFVASESILATSFMNVGNAYILGTSLIVQLNSGHLRESELNVSDGKNHSASISC